MDSVKANDIVKEVRKKFKKGTKKFYIELGMVGCIKEAYDYANHTLGVLSNSFNKDEKEKYSFNKLKVGVTPLNGIYAVRISYGY